MQVILSSLSALSFVFELASLGLGFYFKQSKIFFIALALLCARTLYLYTSLYQAHLFNSLFLPFVFALFVLLPDKHLIFDKANLNKLAILLFTGILALFLSKSTDFNAALSRPLNLGPLEPLSDLSLVFTAVLALFLLLKSLKSRRFFYLLAFILCFVQFCFARLCGYGFFEFASLLFVFSMLYHHYRLAFLDKRTHLGNLQSLKRYIKGLEGFYLGILQPLNADDEMMKQVAKVLKHQDLKGKIFVLEDEFIFVSSDGLDLKENLEQLKKGFEQSALNLNIKINSISPQESLEKSLSELKKGLS